MGLTLNIDAAATAFVRGQRLVEFIATLLEMRSPDDLRRPPREWNVGPQALKRLKQNTKGLEVEFRIKDQGGNGLPRRKFTIFGFSKQNCREFM